MTRIQNCKTLVLVIQMQTQFPKSYVLQQVYFTFYTVEHGKEKNKCILTLTIFTTCVYGHVYTVFMMDNKSIVVTVLWCKFGKNTVSKNRY